MASPLQYFRLMETGSKKDTAQPGLQRDPDDWKTGDEPMTEAQRSYLRTLCEETGEEFDDSMSKAEASKRIDNRRALPMSDARSRITTPRTAAGPTVYRSGRRCSAARTWVRRRVVGLTAGKSYRTD